MKKLVPLLLTLALVAPAAASANTNRDGTLAVSPATPVVGDLLVFSGCGYEPGVNVTVAVQSPFAYSWFGGLPGDDGCFVTAAYLMAETPGAYEAFAWQSNFHHPDATLDFSVS